MPQLNGPEQAEIAKLLSEYIANATQLDQILNHSDLGRLANHEGYTLPQQVNSLVRNFSNQFRVVELVTAILNYSQGLDGSCPPLSQWLDRTKKKLSEREDSIVKAVTSVNSSEPTHSDSQNFAPTASPFSEAPATRIQVYISFAWGEETTPEGRLRTEAIDKLEQRLEAWGYKLLVDRNQLRSGDLISDFMKQIGKGDHVVVILSEKYLRSTYCMTELKYIYDRSLGEKDEFLKRVLPVVLPDARIDDYRGRRAVAKYWRNEYEDMESSLKDLGAEDVRRYHMTRMWHASIGDILSFISDKLTPRSWKEIAKDDFAALRGMLPPPNGDSGNEGPAPSKNEAVASHKRHFPAQLTVPLILMVGMLVLVGVYVVLQSIAAMPKRTDVAPVAKTTAPPEPTIEVTPEPPSNVSFYTVDHYGEDRNVEEDLKMTMARAATEQKRILLQVGGDWSSSCKLLSAIVEKDEPVRSSLNRNYLLMKVAYTPIQENEAFLSNYPKIQGYPHWFVLDAEGKLLHSQETESLEKGKGYNADAVLAFLENWKPMKD